jgi:hypothetical protein
LALIQEPGTSERIRKVAGDEIDLGE